VKFAFAGDRGVAVRILDFLVQRGDMPSALLVSETSLATHANDLQELLPSTVPVLTGSEFRGPEGIALLEELNLHLVVAVHFPYLVPVRILDIPRRGWVNLHPSYLPYNRGWHTPTWAILEDTPAGATLHAMSPTVDAGPILHQRETPKEPHDTAHALYQRIIETEVEVFKEKWPELSTGAWEPRRQPEGGTTHDRRELERSGIRRIDFNQRIRTEDVLRRIRALTTNDVREAAYFEVDNRRFHVQIDIREVYE
jgi:methionyl-tRNA formyltransferase